ncbi:MULTISPECIES: M28 family metallopeptidase [Clostridium]|uniref:M28 family metallopeptidase n=1 Tax=Clostridium TaxID=1485 RepID=UPI0008227045|nr:M28 family peptidase [Clostridium saudiense]MDU7453699.1 M28 family peptidase [Clostridium saudiense]SCJ87131.1 alkaline phosphatase isozyme conversion aminopeptidase [uncultured Clostridium sp.]
MIYKKILLVLSISIISLSLISCSKNDLSIDATENSKSIESNDLKEEENEETVSIDKQEVINKLCSDEFEGRWIGSAGNELAEEYINDLFGQIGLIPIFNESYKEEYTQEVYKNYGLIAEDDYGEVKTINNIVGKIEGNSNNAVIISAHFDHIGIQDGKIIRGAIDNASGVSVLLDLAEILNNKYSVNEPAFDIIFCAFNGEECGLTGSEKFIEDINGKYDNLININIDSVGYKDGGKVTFLDRNTDTSLYEPMKEVIENNGLEVELNTGLKGTADSVEFDRAGISAICIIDENVKEVIHTENDTPELIDYDRLDKVVKSVDDFVSSFKFN